jgi:hypothetical protein
MRLRSGVTKPRKIAVSKDRNSCGGAVALALSVTLLLPGILGAQTVPSDLLDVSIDALFEANVLSESQRASRESRWHVSYTYAFSKYSEYYNGTQKLSYDDVLFSPGEEPRTPDNYPVVPTKIEQDVHALLLAYDLSDDTTLRLQAPFVAQSTDHISVVPGYDAFTIESEGIGDVIVVADRRLAHSVNSSWRAGIGLSIPTGSIDEEGDTPRAPGNQQLPYTMQLGSGTWDLPVLLSYQKAESKLNWGLDADATFRTGTNDRGYRLGNKARFGGWLRTSTIDLFSIGMKLDYVWRDSIHGEDEALSVPNPAFPYPAAVVNPDAFGGEQVDLTVFSRIDISPYWYGEVRYSRPVYLDLNGPQSAEKYHFSVELGTYF